MRAPISIVIRGGDLIGALMSLAEGLEAGLICDVWLVGGTLQEQAVAQAAGVGTVRHMAQVPATGAYVVTLPAGGVLGAGWAAVALGSLQQGLGCRLPLLHGDVRMARRQRVGD